MKAIKIISLIVLFNGIISCNSQNNSGGQDLSSLSNVIFERNQTFQEFLENVRQNYQLPAIAAAVVTFDSVLYLDAAGYNSTNDSIKINKSSLFNLGSCAKSLTSLLVAKYAQFQLKCLFEDDETLLKPELVDKLHQPVINIAGNENYGLG